MTWMNLENSMLSKISMTKTKDRYCTIPLMRNKKAENRSEVTRD
jgi:hypothetical protein